MSSASVLSGDRSIQFDPALSPANWVVKGSVDLNVLLFGNSLVKEVEGLPRGTLSDQEYISLEFFQGANFVMSQPEYIAGFAGFSNSWIVEVQNMQPLESAYPKVCPACGTLNSLHSRLCQSCRFTLPLIAAIRSAASADSKASTGFRRPPPRRRHSSDEIMFFDEHDRLVRKKVPFRLSVLPTISKHEAADENEYSSQAAPGESVLHSHLLRRVLPSVFVNPASDHAIQSIYEEWGRRCNLAGFLDATVLAQDVRHWIFICSDLGAVRYRLIDNPSSQLYRFVHIMGTFHENHMFLEVTLDILFSIGGGVLAALHTFESPNAQALLREAGDTHKANDFLRNVVKPAMTLAYLTAYKATLSASEDGGEVTFKDIDLAAAIKWGEDAINDVNCIDLKFKSYAIFLLRILPSYELIKKGIRMGDISAYNTGRRYLLPYVFALGRRKYGPAVVRDMIQYYHRAPTVIREHMNVIFGLSNEGIDGKVEESNKAQKKYTISNTRNGVQAGALLAAQANTLREAQLNFSATTNLHRDNESEQRTPTQLTNDVRLCMGHLLQVKAFEKAASGVATKAVQFDGKDTAIVPGMMPHELLDYGTGLMKKWAETYKRSDHNFPTCGAGKSFQPRKKKGGGKGGGNEIPAGQDAGDDQVDEEEEVE